MNLILQAENEYNNTMKNAVAEAEKYVDECKDAQRVYLKELKNEWHLFEMIENEKLEKAFSKDEQKMKDEIIKLKEQLKICQMRKVESISERLKKEVLSLDGYN